MGSKLWEMSYKLPHGLWLLEHKRPGTKVPGLENLAKNLVKNLVKNLAIN